MLITHRVGGALRCQSDFELRGCLSGTQDDLHLTYVGEGLPGVKPKGQERGSETQNQRRHNHHDQRGRPWFCFVSISHRALLPTSIRRDLFLVPFGALSSIGE